MLLSLPSNMIVPELGRRSKEVFEILCMSAEGMTMGEVFEYLKVSGAEMLGFNENLTSRANDLERLGLIRRAPKRRQCAVSGVSCTVWHVNLETDHTTPVRKLTTERLSRLMIACANAALDFVNDPSETNRKAAREAAEACFTPVG